VANPEAGERFEEYVRVALARSKSIHSVADLLRATKLHPNTLYDLFNGETNEPGPRTVSAIATALEVPVADLWAAWQGLELAPDSIEEALRRHTTAVDRQNALLGELVGYIRSSAFAIIEAGGGAEQIRGSRVAIGAAQEDPSEGLEGAPPSEPVAFAPRRTPAEGTPRQPPRRPRDP
jgi:hypothetical protein